MRCRDLGYSLPYDHTNNYCTSALAWLLSPPTHCETACRSTVAAMPQHSATMHGDPLWHMPANIGSRSMHTSHMHDHRRQPVPNSTKNADDIAESHPMTSATYSDGLSHSTQLAMPRYTNCGETPLRTYQRQGRILPWTVNVSGGGIAAPYA